MYHWAPHVQYTPQYFNEVEVHQLVARRSLARPDLQALIIGSGGPRIICERGKLSLVPRRPRENYAKAFA